MAAAVDTVQVQSVPADRWSLHGPELQARCSGSTAVQASGTESEVILWRVLLHLVDGRSMQCRTTRCIHTTGGLHVEDPTDLPSYPSTPFTSSRLQLCWATCGTFSHIPHGLRASARDHRCSRSGSRGILVVPILAGFSAYVSICPFRHMFALLGRS